MIDTRDIFSVARKDYWMIQDLARELAILMDDIRLDRLANEKYKAKALDSASRTLSRYHELLEKGKDKMWVIDWLSSVYSLVGQDREDEALDLVFDYIDDLFLAGNFSQPNDLLPQVDLDKLNITVMLGFLTITSPAKDKLSNRQAFYESVEEKIRDLDPDNLEELLSGLR